VKPLVLVTGASGYIAMSVIRRLVDRNYKVRGTVRNLADEEKVGPLKRMFPKVELFEADLLGGPEAFEKAMEGCKYVMHTASPFRMNIEDVEKDLLEPAIKGTENVIRAAGKAGVSRVVLTSSVAAVGPPASWFQDASVADKEKIFTEEDWTSDEPDNNKDAMKGYRKSKVMAEKRAWELVKEFEGLSLVTILPSFVLGPMLSSRSDGESISFIRSVLDGSLKENGCKGNSLGVVDVRDVSLAHVAALETDDAAGKRFLITSERGYSRIEMCNLIRDQFKAYPIPTEGTEPPYQPKFDTSRAKEILKFSPKPVQVSLSDMANAALRLGLVAKKTFLKPVKFKTIADVLPDSKGIDLLVKVVSMGKTEEVKSAAGTQIAKEVVVGDDTGIVTLRLLGDEAAAISDDAIVEVRNASVKMFGGYIRLIVTKWGKVSKHEGDVTITPKMDKDISAVEYELVPV